MGSKRKSAGDLYMNLVDSEADSNEDLLKFDDDSDEQNDVKESSLAPKDDSHNKKHRSSPLHMSPLEKLKKHVTGEDRQSLIEDNDDDDDNYEEMKDFNVGDPGSEDVKQPSSKWGMLKKPNQEPAKVDEKRVDVVEAASLNKEDKPEPPKPGGAWLKLKDMNSSNKETPDDATPTTQPSTVAAPKLSGWGKLKARQNLQEDEAPATEKKEEPNSIPSPASAGAPKVSGWGKLKARQNLQNTETETTNIDKPADAPRSTGWGKLRARQNVGSVEMKPMSTETPGKRKLDSLAGAAYAVHATQKVTGVLQDKTKERISIKNRLALKERMAKLVAERLTVKQIFKRYVETSTLHGFCYVFSETFMIRRVIWAILMILGAVYFLIKLNDGIIKFFSYPFSTLSSMEYVPNLIFPAMSFCSINSYKLENFNKSILSKIRQTSGLPLFSNLTDPGFDIDGQQLHDAILDSAHEIDDLARDCDWIPQYTDHPFMSFLDCGSHNFTRYVSEQGEVCYTLNSGEVGHPLLNVDHSGLGHGYELLFDLNAPGSLLTHSFNGIRVILHDQSEPPVSSTGFLLTPGFRTFVGIERTETISLPPPVSTKCGEKPLKYFKEYNQKACFLETTTDMVGKHCGCRQHHMPDNNMTYCSLQQEIHCARPYKDQINDFDLIDLCPIGCKSTSFQGKLTDARFLHNPPQGIMPNLILQNAKIKKNQNTSHIVDISRKVNSSEELDTYIEENIIQVIFFFPEMKKYVNKQIRTFSFYNFLGGVGGEFGLMLGASLLTFAEFMDLILFLVYHQLLRLQKQKNEDKEEDEKDKKKKNKEKSHPV